jgi:hypothetical protein
MLLFTVINILEYKSKNINIMYRSKVGRWDAKRGILKVFLIKQD